MEGNIQNNDNNFQKKVILLFLITLAVLSLFSFFFYKLLFSNNEEIVKNTKEKVQEKITEVIGSFNADPDKKQIFAESKDWYDTKIEYPHDNLMVKNTIFQIYNDFAADTQILKYTNAEDAKKDLGISSEEAKYTFDAKYTIATGTESKSYLYNVYSFTGGAHGSQNTTAINLDNTGNKIDIESILPLRLLPKIAKIARLQIVEEKKKRMKANKMTDVEIRQILKNDDMLEEGM
jgi:hypothetical protein